MKYKEVVDNINKLQKIFSMSIKESDKQNKS